MLIGNSVRLRARIDSDVPILHENFYDDVSTRLQITSHAWRPVPLSSGSSPFAVKGPTPDEAFFSVVQRADDSLAGAALLWGIDTHNRNAHLGISLLPEYRGRGLGTDVINVLCRYGFLVLGLNRLQLETLSDNSAMIAAAQKAGFTVEGSLRSVAWVNGAFCDETYLGLLATEWDMTSVSPE
jgi:RimJ/RimL family protein N-acetyltransferase